MRGHVPRLAIFLAVLGHQCLVTSRALTQSTDIRLWCGETDCPDLPYEPILALTGISLSKRSDIVVGHPDDVPPAPHSDTGPGSDGSGGQNPGGDPPVIGAPPGGHDPASTGGDPSIIGAPGAQDDVSSSRDPGRVLAYDDYKSRGVSASTRLESTITNKASDKTVTSLDQADGNTKYAKVADCYTMAKSTRKLNHLWGVFRDQDVRIYEDTDFSRVKLTSSNPANPGTEEVFDASFSPRDGAIIISNMDKRQDTWLQGSIQDIRLSEMMAQVYRDEGGDMRVLHVVVQDTILNEGTLSILNSVYERLGLQTTDLGLFPRPVGGADDESSKAFYALLGSDNVRPTEFMLTDHHNEAGDLRIERIITFPPFYPNGGDHYAWHIAILI